MLHFSYQCVSVCVYMGIIHISKHFKEELGLDYRQMASGY